MKNTLKPQTTLVVIIASFFLPILIAHVLYHSAVALEKNPHGTLTHASVTLPDQKQWTLGYLQHSQSTPEAQLNTLGKRWFALGKERHRVALRQFVSKSTPQTPHTIWPPIELSTPDMHTLGELRTKEQTQCSFFILHPKGDIVLCYPETVTPKHIDLDLRKLLKYSRDR